MRDDVGGSILRPQFHVQRRLSPCLYEQSASGALVDVWRCGLLSAAGTHERQLPLEGQHGDEQAERVVKREVSVEGCGHCELDREREQRPPDRIRATYRHRDAFGTGSGFQACIAGEERRLL